MEKHTDLLKIIEDININQPDFSKLSFTEKSKVFLKFTNISKGGFSIKFFQKETTYKAFMSDLAKAIQKLLQNKENDIGNITDICMIVQKFISVKDISLQPLPSMNDKLSLTFDYCENTILTQYILFVNKIFQDDKDSPEIINKSYNLGSPTILILKRLFLLKVEIDMSTIESYINQIINNLLNFLEGILSDKYFFGAIEMVKDNTFCEIFSLLEILTEKWIHQKIYCIIEKHGKISSNYALNKTILKYIDDNMCLDQLWIPIIKSQNDIYIFDLINEIKSIAQFGNIFSGAKLITIRTANKLGEIFLSKIESFLVEIADKKKEEQRELIQKLINEVTELSLLHFKIHFIDEQNGDILLCKSLKDIAKELTMKSNIIMNISLKKDETKNPLFQNLFFYKTLIQFINSKINAQSNELFCFEMANTLYWMLIDTPINFLILRKLLNINNQLIGLLIIKDESIVDIVISIFTHLITVIDDFSDDGDDILSFISVLPNVEELQIYAKILRSLIKFAQFSTNFLERLAKKDCLMIICAELIKLFQPNEKKMNEEILLSLLTLMKMLTINNKIAFEIFMRSNPILILINYLIQENIKNSIGIMQFRYFLVAEEIKTLNQTNNLRSIIEILSNETVFIFSRIELLKIIFKVITINNISLKISILKDHKILQIIGSIIKYLSKIELNDINENYKLCQKKSNILNEILVNSDKAIKELYLLNKKSKKYELFYSYSLKQFYEFLREDNPQQKQNNMNKIFAFIFRNIEESKLPKLPIKTLSISQYNTEQDILETTILFCPQLLTIICDILNKENEFDMIKMFLNKIKIVSIINTICFYELIEIKFVTILYTYFKHALLDFMHPLHENFLEFYMYWIQKAFTIDQEKLLSELLIKASKSPDRKLFNYLIEQIITLCERNAVRFTAIPLSPGNIESNYNAIWIPSIKKSNIFNGRKQEEPLTNFTYSIWLKFEKNELKLPLNMPFSLMKLFYGNEALLDFYFIHEKLYFAITGEDENREISESLSQYYFKKFYSNYYEKWINIVLTCEFASDSQNDMGLFVYIDGFFLDRITLFDTKFPNILKNFKNDNTMQMMIGFQYHQKLDKPQNNIEIGMVHLYDRVLSREDINKLYIVSSCSRSNLNLLKKYHEVNLNLIRIENLLNFHSEFRNEQAISYASKSQYHEKIWLNEDFSNVISSMIFSYSSKNLKVISSDETTSKLIDSLPSKIFQNFDVEIFKSKDFTCLPNEINYLDLQTYGFLIGINAEKLLIHPFAKTLLAKSEILTVIENTIFIDRLLNLFLTSNKQEIQLQILRLIVSLIKSSSKLNDYWTLKNGICIILAYYEDKKQDFNENLLRSLFHLFYTEYTSSSQKSNLCCKIISSPKTLKAMIFETELLKLQDESLVIMMLEFITNDLLDTKNHFYEYNIQKLREISIIQGFLDFLLTEIYSDLLKNKILGIIHSIMKPLKSMEIDYQGIQNIIDVFNIAIITSKKINFIKKNENKTPEKDSLYNEEEGKILEENINKEIINQNQVSKKQKFFTEAINSLIKKFQNLSKIEISKIKCINKSLFDLLLEIMDQNISFIYEEKITNIICHILNISLYFLDQNHGLLILKSVFQILNSLPPDEVEKKTPHDLLKPENIYNTFNIEKKVLTPLQIFKQDLKKYLKDLIILYFKLIKDNITEYQHHKFFNFFLILEDNKHLVLDIDSNDENEFFACFMYELIPLFNKDDMNIKIKSIYFLFKFYHFAPEKLKKVFICNEGFHEILHQFFLKLGFNNNLQNELIPQKTLMNPLLAFFEENRGILKKIRESKLKPYWINYCLDMKKIIESITLNIESSRSVILDEDQYDFNIDQTLNIIPPKVKLIIAKPKRRLTVDNLKTSLIDDTDQVKQNILTDNIKNDVKFPRFKDIISLEKIKENFEISFNHLENRIKTLKFNKHTNKILLKKFKNLQKIKFFHEKLISKANNGKNINGEYHDDESSNLFWHINNYSYLSNQRNKISLKEMQFTKNSLERKKPIKKKIIEDLERNHLLMLPTSASRSAENDDETTQDSERMLQVISHEEEKKNSNSDISETKSELEFEDNNFECLEQETKQLKNNDHFDLNDLNTTKYNCLRVQIVEKTECIMIIGNIGLIIYENYQIQSDGTIIDVAGNYENDRRKWVMPVVMETHNAMDIKDIDSNNDKTEHNLINHKEIRIPFKNILEIHTRRFLLKNNAIEIYLKNKKSYFLVFNPHLRNDIFLKILNSHIYFHNPKAKLIKFLPNKGDVQFFASPFRNPFIPDIEESKLSTINLRLYDSSVLVKVLQNLWINGKFSNYDYLMLLNMISGRTFNDLSQYPVFPWIIDSLNSESLDFDDSKTYRDLSKPMGSLTNERRENAKRTYAETLDDILQLPPYHYGSHYSSPAILMYYFIRLSPFCKLAANLQGGSFDYPDRLFTGVEETYEKAKTMDYKELTPEFFMMPEFVLNMNRFNFGTTQSNEEVDNVILPIWTLQDPRIFIRIMRRSLESKWTSQEINKWIDLKFGAKQRGKKAIEALNVFHVLTYENSVNLETIQTPLEGILVQISEFGQTPKKLFKNEHPSKKKLEKCTALFYKLDFLKSCTLNFQFEFDTMQIHRNIKINSFKILGERFAYPAAISTGLSSHAKFACLSSRPNQVEMPKTDNIYISTGNFWLLDHKCKKAFGINSFFNIWCYVSYKADTLKYKYFEANSDITQILHDDDQLPYLIAGTKTGSFEIYTINKKCSRTALKPKKEDYLFLFSKKQTKLENPELDNRRNIFTSAILTKIELQSILNENSDQRIEEFLFKGVEISSQKIGLDTIREFNENLMKINKDHQILHEKHKILGKFVKIHQKAKLDSFQKLKNTITKKKNSNEVVIELVKIIPNVHNAKISALSLSKQFDLMISGDVEGICRLWDYRKLEPEKILYTNHYENHELFKKCLNFDPNHHYIDSYRVLVPREKIRHISICEENGDFLVVSKNYISVYSINGILVAILSRREAKMAQFTSGIIVNNKYRFEDDYIITGHKDGKICFWILTQKKENAKFCPKKSKNIYTEFYNGQINKTHKLNMLILPCKIKLIYENALFSQLHDNAMEKNLKPNNKKIMYMHLSFDQRKLLFATQQAKIYAIELPNDYLTKSSVISTVKKCTNCQLIISVLDKKILCGICQQVFCLSCAKHEIFIAEISLRKKNKVCETCYLENYNKSNLSIYDYHHD